ncbi:MAG TPA: hypothetical protein VJB36_02760 [Methylomirabilota bacterium]|nr:hypothetical protein [Methylomirabilota bacterium]
MTLRTPHRAGRLAVLLTLAVSVLAFGACGDGGSEATTPQGSVEDQLGFDTAGIQERQSRVEAAISECMKVQGFEYVPIDPLAQRAAVTGSARLSDEDFLNQFGYGVSTVIGRGGEQADPNEQIRAGLSDADRAAYERALWGENDGATFAQAVDTGDFTRLGGCTKQSTEAVFGGGDVLTTLQGKLDELDERIVQDQRMVRAIEQWGACMVEAGFKYEDPDDIDPDFLERLREIVGSPVEIGVTALPEGANFEQAELAALQREEVATAVADLACEEEHITPVEDEVRPQYEAEFRQANADLITQVQPAGRG